MALNAIRVACFFVSQGKLARLSAPLTPADSTQKKYYMTSHASTTSLAESLILSGDASVDVAALWTRQVCELARSIEGARGGSPAATTPESQKSRVVVVLDIEGTITPLYFVTRVLFPYFLQHVRSFVQQCVTAAVVSDAIAKQRANSSSSSSSSSILDVVGEFLAYSAQPVSYDDASGAADVFRVAVDAAAHAVAASASGDDAAAAASAMSELLDLLVADCRSHTLANRKIVYMKRLQGLLWHSGYADGRIVGDVFTDLVPFLVECHAAPEGAVPVHIYSSGSVLAQKLLLKHSSHGDLTRYVAGYNDTVTAGPKFEAASYTSIIDGVVGAGSPAAVVVFVSDSIQELVAARQAGCVAVLAVRPLNAPTASASSDDFPSIISLEQLTECLRGAEPAAVRALRVVRADVAAYADTDSTLERKVF